jgi:hypothetical protein
VQYSLQLDVLWGWDSCQFPGNGAHRLQSPGLQLGR